MLNPKPAVAGGANLLLALLLALPLALLLLALLALLALLLALLLLALLALLIAFIFIHVKYLLWENLHRVILRWVELHLRNLRLSITQCTRCASHTAQKVPFCRTHSRYARVQQVLQQRT